MNIASFILHYFRDLIMILNKFCLHFVSRNNKSLACVNGLNIIITAISENGCILFMLYE